MIKLIHKYKRSITIIFILLAFCFALSGVGIDTLHDGNRAQRPAISVNDRQISQVEFQRTERSIEERYRRMFGTNFEQFVQAFGVNIAQQAIDQSIDSALLNQEAAGIGFAADDEVVRRFILEKVFADVPYDEGRFRAILQSAGLTYREFGSEIKDEYSRETLANVLRDSAYVSKRDVDAQMARQETAYSVLGAVVRTSKLLASAPQPSEEQLKAFYSANGSRFEVPAQVSYSFIELAPSSFEKEVQVSQQDIEVYYTENSGSFTNPEQVKVREITVLYPKGADDKAKESAKARAKQARDEAVAGKVFADLVAKYSDNADLKRSGGDRGWVSRGQESPQFERVAFATEPGSVTELVETPEGLRVIKVEERKASSLKPLDSVRAQIESAIRKAEAPSYAAARAQEILKAARRDGKPILEVGGAAGLPVKDSGGLVASGKDPSPSLAGLSAKVLDLSSSDRAGLSLVEAGDTSVIVQVKEYKEPSVAPFAEVRPKILEAVKAQEAQGAAEKLSQQILAAVQGNPASFEAEAKKLGAEIVGPVELSRANPKSSELQDLPNQAFNAIFATEAAPSVLQQAYQTESGYVALSVVSVKKPDPTRKRTAAEVAKFRAEAKQQAVRDAMESALTVLKTSSVIDVDPALQLKQ